jgi:hypothetical protein
MRDDEDNIRQYLPVLRRIIILVAVLTAIPVVMWTITAFVRSHVSPPQAPALQPMAIAPSSHANTTVAAASEQPPAQPVSATPAAPQDAPVATPDDGSGVTPASAYAPPTEAPPPLKTAAVGGPPDTAKDDATPATTVSADVAISPTDNTAPTESPDNGTQVAARPQQSIWPAPPAAPVAPAAAADDTLPTGEPISGRVPLPRKRPKSFAVVGNIPLPVPRPEAAGGDTPAPAPTPIDWLKKIFHSSAAPAQRSDNAGDE